MKSIKLPSGYTVVLSVVGLWFAAWLSIMFVDRQLALSIHASGWDRYLVLRTITEKVPEFLSLAAIVLLLLRFLQQRRVAELGLALYFYLALQLTISVKTGLKDIFGRYWPQTWIQHNLSLIQNGVYGFNWWHGFANQGSFPSGHSSYVSFCVVWLCLLQPSLRWLWCLSWLVTIACLIILNYHFLGDCLAGIGLGGGMAVLSAWLWCFVWNKFKH